MANVEISGSEEAAVLVIRSDGLAAEWHGGRLGQYELKGELNNCPYYVQTTTNKYQHSTSPPNYLNTIYHLPSTTNYLYRADDKEWYVSSVLGKRGGGLNNLRESETVPGDGWLVGDGKGWTADPQCRVSPGPLSECGDITVSASTDSPTYESVRPNPLGVFKPTDMFSSGRRVFKHQSSERYLSIPPGKNTWMITDATRAGKALLRSAAGANCPASERNRFSGLSLESWSCYMDMDYHHEWKEDPSITVTCTKHSKDFSLSQYRYTVTGQKIFIDVNSKEYRLFKH